MPAEWQNGVDTFAHRGTLETKGKTIAVLGNGFNNIFPKENIKLYQEIIKSGGLIISEYPPDIKAESKYFLARNRIVSGISIGVLIVEAAYRSGTSVTARFATEQNKKVFVLPHEIEDIHGVGTNRLIRKGAILVTSAEEIINEFKFLEYKKIHKDVRKQEINTIQKTKERNREKQERDKKQKEIDRQEQEKKQKEINMSKLKNKKEQKIYKIITTEVISINEICKKSNMPFYEISSILFSLEIEGYIEKVAGGYRCILNKE